MNIRYITARVLAPFSAKPTRLLWVLPILMAMEGPTCVMSERPLSRLGDAAVDERLLGDWVEPSAEPTGGWYSVRRNEAGGIEIRAIEADGTYLVMDGYTSQVGDLSFLNLQYVRADCLGCTDAELAAWQQEFADDYSTLTVSNPANTCTWLIQYYHFDEDGAVHFVIPDDEPVLDAFETGELDGREGKDAATASEFDGICLTGSMRQIRRFMANSVDELFLDTNDEVFVRRSVDAVSQ